MCSQGAFGGALRCPEYAKDLPRKELVETLRTQFIRRGFPIDIPADCWDEARWSRDEVAVFFQSGGSVKPRCTLLDEAGIAMTAGADHPEGASAMAAEPAVRLSLEGRLARAAELRSAPGDGAAAPEQAKADEPEPEPEPEAAPDDDEEEDGELPGEFGF